MKEKIQKISKYRPSIFQARLDFSPGRSFSLTVEHPHEQLVFRALAGTLVALGFSYVYFVGATILNVIARKETVRETAALETNVSKLERDYLVAAKAVTPRDGARLGLAPVTQSSFVYRPGATAVATIERNAL
jgi:hypothetical protein